MNYLEALRALTLSPGDWHMICNRGPCMQRQGPAPQIVTGDTRVTFGPIQMSQLRNPSLLWLQCDQ